MNSFLSGLFIWSRRWLASCALAATAALGAGTEPPALPAEPTAPVLLFIHGWTCDASFWAGTIQDLGPKYRMLTLDLPGHGRTPLPPDGIGPTTFADAVGQALDAAHVRRVILVGHSLGGVVARHYARLHPERVRALVLVEAPMRFPDSPEMRAWAGGFGGPQGRQHRQEFIESMFGPDASPELRAGVLARMLAPSEETAVQAARWLIAPQTMPEGDRFPDLPVLSVVRSPARPVPAWMQALFPRLQRVEVAGAGHFLMLERPAEFERALTTFVDRIAAEPPVR